MNERYALKIKTTFKWNNWLHLHSAPDPPGGSDWSEQWLDSNEPNSTEGAAGGLDQAESPPSQRIPSAPALASRNNQHNYFQGLLLIGTIFN